MNATISEIFALSILIPAAIALVRFNDVDRSFYPFFVLLWIGALNEVLSVVLLSLGYPTLINNNIYVLGEALSILWFFRNVGAEFLKKGIFLLLASSFIIFWLVENFIIGTITQISSYFRIYYSFVVVILSITTVNHQIVSITKSLLKLPLFLITIGFIIYFTYKILVEAFWVYGLNNSRQFQQNVYAIMMYLNLFVNLLFALAVLWIPRKREFILLY
jgi:hypothetical protein